MAHTEAPIVSAGWLTAHRSEVVVCDVRWYLDGRSGRDAYGRGHLPGAVFVDLERRLAAPPSPERGRHPLPDPAVFAAGMREAGIDNGTGVVAYDDTGGATAARLVWLLRVCGESAALLDGGMAAWREPLSRIAPVVRPGSFELAAWPDEPFADADQVADAVAHGGVVLDARAAARYSGTVEPVDPRAGHIPGAVNVPHADNLNPSTSRFHDPEVLRRRYAEAGVGADGDAIVYCGSGVTACHVLLAIELAGLPTARLFPGSWSQWSSDPARPVATGRTADDDTS